MYKSFLSHAQLKEYLSFLAEKRLLEKLSLPSKNTGNEKSRYRITQKGLRFLHVVRDQKSDRSRKYLLIYLFHTSSKCILGKIDEND